MTKITTVAMSTITTVAMSTITTVAMTTITTVAMTTNVFLLHMPHLVQTHLLMFGTVAGIPKRLSTVRASKRSHPAMYHVDVQDVPVTSFKGFVTVLTGVRTGDRVGQS